MLAALTVATLGALALLWLMIIYHCVGVVEQHIEDNERGHEDGEAEVS